METYVLMNLIPVVGGAMQGMRADERCLCRRNTNFFWVHAYDDVVVMRVKGSFTEYILVVYPVFIYPVVKQPSKHACLEMNNIEINCARMLTFEYMLSLQARTTEQAVS